MTPSAIWWLRLYKRVKRWRSLPEDGGILDQEERTMRQLDLIADLVQEHEEERAKVEKARRENQATMERLGIRGFR